MEDRIILPFANRRESNFRKKSKKYTPEKPQKTNPVGFI